MTKASPQGMMIDMERLPTSHSVPPQSKDGTFDVTDNPSPVPSGGTQQVKLVKTETAPVETRPAARSFGIKRPRALHYYHEANLIQVGDEEGPATQRERLDLFIDLLWVGIISNISEHFSDTAFAPPASVVNTPTPDYGYAFAEYSILFLTAWHIWNFLRDFLNNFFIDDILQRVLVLWILVLALLFGNNVTYCFENENSTGIIIGIFLITSATFLVVEATYTIFIPKMRAQLFWNWVTALPSSGLYLAGIFVAWPNNIALFFAAIIAEFFRFAAMNSPLGDRLVRHHFKKAPDMKLMAERFEGFFIIIIGEGVFLLIKDSPLGQGLNANAGNGVMVLMSYYCLSCLYFNSDNSKTFIHGLNRNWWTSSLWMTVHIVLYGSFLVLDAAILVLLTMAQTTTSAGGDSDPSASTKRDGSDVLTPDEVTHVFLSAKFTAAMGLTVTLVSMTTLALFNKSLDPPGTLKVNNRYFRLAPRLIAAVVFSALIADKNMTLRAFLAIIAALLFATVMWEWYAGLDAGAKLIEPADKNEAGSERVDGEEVEEQLEVN